MLVKIGTHQVCYHSYGDSSFRNVAFYFHGLPGSSFEVSFIENQARSSGVTVVAFDRPGMCDSDYDSHRSVTDISIIVDAIAAKHNIQAYALVGVSGGTPYALAVAANNPENVRSCIIISGIGPVYLPEVRNRMHGFYKFTLGLVAGFPLLGDLLIAAMRKLWKVTPKLMLWFFQLSLSMADKIILKTADNAEFFIKNMLEALKMSHKGVSKEVRLLVLPWNIDYRKICCPVTFLHGTDDHYVPFFMAEANSKNISGTRVEPVCGAGHLMFFEMGERICQIILQSDGS